MPRVSSGRSSGKAEPDKAHRSPSARKYVAKTDYGTRGSERNKKIIRFGSYRVTLYRRSDVGHSSWFLRVHLTKERRHYRKSLRTTDIVEAKERAHHEIVNLLAKVQTGQRILALSLGDLVRRFSLHQQSMATSGQLTARTVTMQNYRVRLGCDFLKTVYPAGLNTKLSAIDGSVFDGYLKWRQAQVAEKRENGTIRRDVVRDELLVIRKMFKYAKKERLCTETSVPSWDFVVEKDTPRRRRITVQNVADYFRVMQSWDSESRKSDDRYNCNVVVNIILLVETSGMRSGEVFGLRNRSVEKRGKDDFLIYIEPDTSKVRKRRQIRVINPALSQWLERYQRHGTPDDYVFTPRDDWERNARDIFYHEYQSLRARLREVNLDWMDLYHFRHWWITKRLMAHESPILVAQAAGTSVKEIERTYSHVLTEMTTMKFNEKVLKMNEDGSFEFVPRKHED